MFCEMCQGVLSLSSVQPKCPAQCVQLTSKNLYAGVTADGAVAASGHAKAVPGARLSTLLSVPHSVLPLELWHVLLGVTRPTANLPHSHDAKPGHKVHAYYAVSAWLNLKM